MLKGIGSCQKNGKVLLGFVPEACNDVGHVFVYQGLNGK